MRIIFHQRVLIGRKTGVGHYASRLLEAMRRLPEELEIGCFPSGLLWSACGAWAALKSGGEARSRSGRGANTPVGDSRSLAPIKWVSRIAHSSLGRCGRFILE